MTFAGNVPEGSYIRLMQSSTHDILASAEDSASDSHEDLGADDGFALVVSCVGRRSLLKNSTEEELEEIREILPAGIAMSGFYSYGEFSSSNEKKGCDLYNQTMTITCMRES